MNLYQVSVGGFMASPIIVLCFAENDKEAFEIAKTTNKAFSERHISWVSIKESPVKKGLVFYTECD